MKNGSKVFFEICSFLFIFALFCAGSLFCIFNDKAMIGDSVLLRMAGELQNGSTTDARKTPEPSLAPQPEKTPKPEPQPTPEPKPVPKMGEKETDVLPFLTLGAVLAAGAFCMVCTGARNEAADIKEKA